MSTLNNFPAWYRTRGERGRPVSSKHRPAADAPIAHLASSFFFHSLCNRLGSRDTCTCIRSLMFNCHQSFLWFSHSCVELPVSSSNFGKDTKCGMDVPVTMRRKASHDRVTFMRWLASSGAQVLTCTAMLMGVSVRCHMYLYLVLLYYGSQ